MKKVSARKPATFKFRATPGTAATIERIAAFKGWTHSRVITEAIKALSPHHRQPKKLPPVKVAPARGDPDFPFPFPK